METLRTQRKLVRLRNRVHAKTLDQFTVAKKELERKMKGNRTINLIERRESRWF